MMKTAPLKSFATKARADLIKEIAARVTVVLAENSLARVESAAAVRALEEAIARDSRDQVIDRVAYTWFNRIVALRFMDANGYIPSRVVSPEAGRTKGQPEVLAEAKAGTFDGAVVPAKTQTTITALLNGTRPSQDPQGEAYGLMLEAYCRHWHATMPFMFEREGDYTELLIPTALLAPDSVRDRAVKTLTEEVCREVEVIGWLYQFYISDRKTEVFDGFKKNMRAGAAEIPAATQLFTPHWIVRYLVENSLGRLWLLNNPSSRLGEQMEYYIKSVDEDTDFLRITKPEELKIIDPAAGSGHMLTYAFDLLYAIYTEKGYDPTEIPGLILQHNLYGTEIDPRAGALAAFALTMKAAAKRKLFLKNPVQPNIRVLENFQFDPAELDYLWSLTKDSELARDDAGEFWNAFEHADTFGSLIQPKDQLLAPLKAAIKGASGDRDLLHAKTLEKARAVIERAEYLSKRYAIVVANPPYMGAKNMTTMLSVFAKERFPDSKSDLFAMFIERNFGLVMASGFIAMITMQSWMFLSSFEELRKRIVREGSVRALAHLGTGAFESIAGAVVSTCAFVLAASPNCDAPAVFVKLDDLPNEKSKLVALLNAAERSDSDIRFRLNRSQIEQIPGWTLSYWMSPPLLDAFAGGERLADVADPRQGMATADNGRFLRFWTEVSADRLGLGLPNREDAAATGRKWFPYNKGGSFRRWYGNQEYVVNWEDDGRELLAERPKSVIRSPQYYFCESASWSKVGTAEPAFRYYPPGFLFDVAGTSIFAPDHSTLLCTLAFGNSKVAREMLRASSTSMNLEVGTIAELPIRVRSSEAIEALAEQLIAIYREDGDRDERSWNFDRPQFLEHPATDVRRAIDCAISDGERVTVLARELEEELNSTFANVYGLGEFLAPDVPVQNVSLNANYLARFGSGNAEASRQAASDAAVLDLVSYAVGCMFGRYSLDKRGLVLADQSSTLRDYLAQVPSPSFMPDKDNVIPVVDGDWFEDDIVARFRQFLRAAFGDERFEENLRFVTESLGVKDIRDYFVRFFYDDHVKRYKKRPIYWLFRSPKGSFSALIYLHRYNPATVSTVLTGYLREFIGKLEANLEHQGRVAAGMGGASARDIANALKEADRIRKVLVELRDYEHDVLFPLAGQQINLDLDDGVLVNYHKLGSALKDIGLKKGGGE